MNRLIHKLLAPFILVVMMMGGPLAAAQSEDATDLIKSTTRELLAEFETNRSTYENDKDALYAMVERVAIPHFDFERMTKLVLGRYAKKATPAEFNAFMGEFKTLLVRTYATALFQYTGQTIDYRPQITEPKYKIVQARVNLERVDPVSIEYYLADRDGALKVFDVSIDGISLVTNYRSAYNAVIRSKGLQALIDDLATKNRNSVQ